MHRNSLQKKKGKKKEDTDDKAEWQQVVCESSQIEDKQILSPGTNERLFLLVDWVDYVRRC
jgi:hypothetical protein